MKLSKFRQLIRKMIKEEMQRVAIEEEIDFKKVGQFDRAWQMPRTKAQYEKLPDHLKRETEKRYKLMLKSLKAKFKPWEKFKGIRGYPQSEREYNRLSDYNKKIIDRDTKYHPGFPLPEPILKRQPDKGDPKTSASLTDWHPEHYPRDYKELPSDLQRGIIDMAKKAGVTKLTPDKVQKFYSRSLENNYDQLQVSSKKQALVLLKQFIAGAEEGYRK